MARQHFLTGPLPGLTATLLALQCLFASSKPTGQDAVSFILSEENRTVPDYVTRYAPLVWLHSEDPFRPSDLLGHVQHTTPWSSNGPVSDLPELDLDNLAILNDIDGGKIALTSDDDVSEIPSWLFGEAPDESGRVANSTPCVVILVEHSPREVDAFFFYFYSFNRGANVTQVLEPLDGLIGHTEDGMHWGNHVGDWEHNMVRFIDGKPSGIYYSQHEDGAAYDWNDLALSMKDERPLAFSAYGSHANYVSPGDHVHDVVAVDYCDAGKLWDPIMSAYFYHLDPDSFALTRLLTPGSDEPPTSNLTSFFYFDGRWGDWAYPSDDPRQNKVPYIGQYRYVTGPQGPAVKHLVREGLFPDERTTRTWVQWGVGIFLSLYPYFLRGWRFWVSLAVVIVLWMLMALGLRRFRRVIRVLRRHRMRGYKRVQTEIPQEDLEP